MRRGGRGRAGGFTLIEVVAVVLVLALATAVVVPAIGRGAEALRARAEVAGFSAFLRHARQQAITRRETQEVRVDPDARRLTLATAGSERVRASRELRSLVSLEASPPPALSVRFMPQGQSTGATFRLEAPGKRVWVITVDPLTGRVAHRRA